MTMSIDLWTTLTLLVTWAGHATTAAAIGGPFAFMYFFRRTPATRWLVRYILVSCSLGIALLAAKFFIQVGSFADQGLAGMADPLYISVLWQTDIRLALFEKLAGFVLVAAASWALMRSEKPAAKPSSFAWVVMGFAIVGIALLAMAHQQVGHTAGASVWAQLAVFLHVIAMGLWIGCLYPLWRACNECEPAQLQKMMARFGTLAAGIVATLVIVGVALLIILVGSIHNLLTTTYGQGLLVKLFLVGALLAIAATNKWLWVPRLVEDPHSVKQLSRSITVEMLVALLILLATSYITTFTGAPY